MSSKIFKGFSKKERIGFIVLLLLIIIGITIWQVLYHFNNETQPVNTETAADWEKFQEEQQDEVSNNNQSYDPESSKNSYSGNAGGSGENPSFQNDDALKAIPYQPKPFDPNSASIETMIASGMPIASAKRIIKYRNKGGTFYNKEKLQNFGLSPEAFDKVAPYISIPPKQKGSYSNNYKKYDNKYEKKTYEKPAEPTKVTINSTNADELMKFKGIGPGYSKRIIEYRNKLGGFLRIEQLKEIYGFPDSTYLHIKDRLVIEVDKIKKLNVNTASEELLAAHPYIGKYMAANIIKLRNDIKEFKNISDLRQVPLINEEKYRKIVPYLKIN